MNAWRHWLGAAALCAALVPVAALADNQSEDRFGAGERLSPAQIAARTRVFGADNVDPRSGRVDKDKVIASWFSVTSLAVAARGHVILMDTYIYRIADKPGYVPVVLQELVDLKPEAIFIGHGHFDHADNAAYIGVKTGAHIFGAAEHCAAFQGDVTRMVSQGILPTGSAVKCTAVTTAGSVPGAEVGSINLMYPDICITTFKHLHSGAAPVDPNYPVNLIGAVRDPRVSELYPTQPAPSIDTRTAAGAGGTVSILYHLTIGKFSFLWHNTAGPIRTFQPQLEPMLAALPKVDVEVGSVVSLGETVTGVYDIGVYIQRVQPKIFYAAHTDNFNIGASPYYQRALLKQLAIFGVPPEARPAIPGFHDPYDYVRPGLATFEWKSARWDEVPAGKSAAQCPTPNN
jgi:hypothetical protein